MGCSATSNINCEAMIVLDNEPDVAVRKNVTILIGLSGCSSRDEQRVYGRQHRSVGKLSVASHSRPIELSVASHSREEHINNNVPNYNNLLGMSWIYCRLTAIGRLVL